MSNSKAISSSVSRCFVVPLTRSSLHLWAERPSVRPFDGSTPVSLLAAFTYMFLLIVWAAFVVFVVFVVKWFVYILGARAAANVATMT